MPVEVSKARVAYQNDLSDLQAEFDRKKGKLVKQQQEEIENIKQGFDERKTHTQEQGQAAVNHIKERQSEDLTHFQEAREKAIVRGRAQVEKTDQVYRQKTEETQANRANLLNEAREKYRNQLTEIQQKDNSRLKALREKSGEEYKKTLDQSQKQMTSLELQNNERLENLREEGHLRARTEVERGKETYQKAREQNIKEINSLRTKDQESVAKENETQQMRLARLDADAKKRLGHTQESWEHRERLLNEEYGQKIVGQKQTFENQLKEQHQRFDSLYQKTEGAQKLSLQIQSQNFAKALADQKQQFLLDVEKYNGKEKDPFYKVQDRGSSLREDSGYYVLEAYVPPHEKESVNVVIEKDRAVVQGQRAFKDQFQDEQKKVSSQNYQSFREEFGFDKPVMMEGVARERSGDYVIITIPKLNSFGDRKLNRKA